MASSFWVFLFAMQPEAQSSECSKHQQPQTMTGSEDNRSRGLEVGPLTCLLANLDFHLMCLLLCGQAALYWSKGWCTCCKHVYPLTKCFCCPPTFLWHLIVSWAMGSIVEICYRRNHMLPDLCPSFGLFWLKKSGHRFKSACLSSHSGSLALTASDQNFPSEL